jgi:hypothetical protein
LKDADRLFQPLRDHPHGFDFFQVFFIPARIMAFSTRGDSLAGPIVQTIFVLGLCSLIMGLSLPFER